MVFPATQENKQQQKNSHFLLDFDSSLGLCQKKEGGFLFFCGGGGGQPLDTETLSPVWNKVPQGESGYSIIITKFNICLVYILRA